MNSSRIAVVVPVGPDGNYPSLSDCKSEFPYLKTIHVYNGCRNPSGADGDFNFYSKDPLGITGAIQEGCKKAMELEPDIVAICYSISYAPYLKGMLLSHIENKAIATVTYRVNPKWNKWTGMVGSRLVHYAARYLLGLGYRDNCSGLYVFKNNIIFNRVYKVQCRDHFFDTELRYWIPWANEYPVAGVVTGGDTLKWGEIKDTVTGFYRLLKDRWTRV